MGGTRGTQDAVANGDTRSLTLYHNHTKESATITFRRNGQYDPRGLEQLNWMLRDWRRDEPTQMDPRLFDTLWEVYRQTGSSEPIHVNSAYRSPQTNAMLRRRSSAVAKSSQHMRGKAMDFYLPDVPIEKIRAIGMRLQNGGVGFYPNAYTPFVHLDVGSVRAWPRMTRDQLARLFPDGKTVHLPSNGKPLARYEEARVEILSRNRVLASAQAGGGSLAGLFGSLFGRKGEAQERQEITTASLPVQGSPVPSIGPAAPLPPSRPQSANASGSTLPSQPARTSTASLGDQSPASRLLFSGLSIVAAPVQPDGAGSPMPTAPAIPLEYFRAPAATTGVADTFTAQPGDEVTPHRFVSRAVRALTNWRMAEAKP
jgi:uncharacterized protein YcbK (DUF882 family)